MNSFVVRLFLNLNFLFGAIFCLWMLSILLIYPASRRSTLDSFAEELQSSPKLDFFRPIGAEWFAGKAKIASQLASANTKPKDLPTLYCVALAGLGRALRFRPWDPALLAGWASARQLLGKTDCGLPFTQGDFEQTLDLSLSRGPATPAVIYSAALIEHWADNLTKRNQLLRRFLESSVRTEPGQVSFIRSAMKLPEDILQILPARFPQVTVLSEASWPKMRSADPALLSALERVQLEALDSVDLSTSTSTLIGLYPFTAGDAARRKLDQTLVSRSDLSEGRGAIDYLSLRASLARIPIVSAYLTSDRRPEKSQFFNWSEQNSFVFDQTNASIGFFLPRGAAPRLIQLDAMTLSPSQIGSAISLFVSSDNLSWVALNQQMRYTQFALANRTIVGLELSQDLSKYRYFKLRVNTAQSQGSFVNDASAMISAYGSYVPN